MGITQDFVTGSRRFKSRRGEIFSLNFLLHLYKTKLHTLKATVQSKTNEEVKSMGKLIIYNHINGNIVTKIHDVLNG